MDNVWFVGITGSVIGSIIVIGFAKLFARFARSRGATLPDWKTIILSITVSTILFMFGHILQAASQLILFEPEKQGLVLLALVRKHYPVLTLTILFGMSLLPGVATGLSACIGRSLGERIVYAIVWAIFSMSILDTIIFFSLVQQTEDIKDYYFGIISNIVGCPVTGMGVAHILMYEP